MENYTIKMKIIRRSNTTKDGRKFYSYKTQILLSDEKDDELKPHWIDVKFDKNINLNQLKGYSIVECNSDDVFVPFKYEIKPKTDKNGVIQFESDGKTPKKEYPHVFIKNILSFKEAPKKKIMQNVFILDEESTEETSID